MINVSLSIRTGYFLIVCIFCIHAQTFNIATFVISNDPKFGYFPPSLADTFKVAAETHSNWRVTHTRFDYEVTRQALTDDIALADIHMLFLASHATKRLFAVWDETRSSTIGYPLVDLGLGSHGNVRIVYLWGCNILEQDTGIGGQYPFWGIYNNPEAYPNSWLYIMQGAQTVLGFAGNIPFDNKYNQISITFNKFWEYFGTAGYTLGEAHFASVRDGINLAGGKTVAPAYVNASLDDPLPADCDGAAIPPGCWVANAKWQSGERIQCAVPCPGNRILQDNLDYCYTYDYEEYTGLLPSPPPPGDSVPASSFNTLLITSLGIVLSATVFIIGHKRNVHPRWRV